MAENRSRALQAVFRGNFSIWRGVLGAAFGKRSNLDENDTLI